MMELIPVDPKDKKNLKNFYHNILCQNKLMLFWCTKFVLKCICLKAFCLNMLAVIMNKIKQKRVFDKHLLRKWTERNLLWWRDDTSRFTPYLCSGTAAVFWPHDPQYNKAALKMDDGQKRRGTGSCQMLLLWLKT